MISLDTDSIELRDRSAAQRSDLFRGADYKLSRKDDRKSFAQNKRGRRNLSRLSATYSSKVPKPEIPTNPLASVYSGSSQPDNGVIYDKKPFKVRLEAGKTYHWCLCGRSKSQPLCDGTHRDIYLKITQRPVRFQVEKTKDYWLCNCKQTKIRPFCDGTHKQKEIQEASSIRV